MFTRDASSSLRSPPLAVIAAILFLATRPAQADEPVVTPERAAAVEPEPGPRTQSGALTSGAHEYVITFEKPDFFWEEATSETWTLKDSTGKAICELP